MGLINKSCALFKYVHYLTVYPVQGSGAYANLQRAHGRGTPWIRCQFMFHPRYYKQVITLCIEDVYLYLKSYVL